MQLCYFWGTGCASIQFVAYAISIEGTKALSQTENTLKTMYCWGKKGVKLLKFNLSATICGHYSTNRIESEVGVLRGGCHMMPRWCMMPRHMKDPPSSSLIGEARGILSADDHQSNKNMIEKNLK